MNQEIYISKTMTWELHLKIFCIGLLVITTSTLLCRLIYVSVWVGVPSLSSCFFFYPFPKTESLFKGYVFLTLQMHYLLLFGYLQSPARGGRVGGWELVVMFIKTQLIRLYFR